MYNRDMAQNELDNALVSLESAVRYISEIDPGEPVQEADEEDQPNSEPEPETEPAEGALF